jgi:hypothetical protein
VSEEYEKAYAALTPARRTFVDGVVAGEIPTQVVRRMRPHLKRPDVIAWKWLQREDVKAAIAEMQLIGDRLTRIEQLMYGTLLERAAKGTMQ